PPTDRLSGSWTGGEGPGRAAGYPVRIPPGGSMLALFSRRRPKATPPAARRVRPRLEWLENRPSPPLLPPSPPSPPHRHPPLTPAGGARGRPGQTGQPPPASYGLAARNGQPPPASYGLAGQTVVFTGEVNGSATTDATGSYSVTLRAAALGDVHGVTADGQSN